MRGSIAPGQAWGHFPSVTSSSTHIAGRVSPVKLMHRSPVPWEPFGSVARSVTKPSASGVAGSGTSASTLPQQVADDAQQHPCIDRSSQLNAYAALTGGLDLARSVHYLALSARLIEQAPAASEQDKLEPWLHPHALMHGYFQAGGGLALDGAVPGVDRAGIEAWRQGQGTLAYRPELLLAFPLHMDDPQRERLFRVTGFALLPTSQWHDRTALRTLIHSDAYLDWLDAPPLHLASRLSMALEEMATPPWPEHLRAAGYQVHGEALHDDEADPD